MHVSSIVSSPGAKQDTKLVTTTSARLCLIYMHMCESHTRLKAVVRLARPVRPIRPNHLRPPGLIVGNGRGAWRNRPTRECNESRNEAMNEPINE